MKKIHSTYLLALSCIFLSYTGTHASSGYERYQEFCNNLKKQAEKADQRQTRLETYKQERALEQKIAEIHPENAYEKLTPHKSYAKFGIHRYATNDEVAQVYAHANFLRATSHGVHAVLPDGFLGNGVQWLFARMDFLRATFAVARHELDWTGASR